MSVVAQPPVVLEPASEQFVEATAKPPFLYELTPADARAVLDDVQAAPIDKLPVDERWITVPAAVGDVRVRIVRPPNYRDPRRLARHHRLAARGDGSADPGGRGGYRARLNA